MTVVVEEQVLALQLISHVVEADQVLYGSFIEDESGENVLEFRFIDEEEGEVREGFPLVIQTENPESGFYHTMVSNAGLLQRKAFPAVKYEGVAKLIDTEKGVKYEYVNKLVHDARGMEITLKLGAFRSPAVFTIAEEEYVRLSEDNVLRLSLDETSVLGRWEPAFGTSSQTRKADMVVKTTSISYHEYFERIGFLPQAFMVPAKEEGMTTIKSLDKMSKRVKQTASSSRPRNFISGFVWEKEEQVPFTMFAGTPEEKKVYQTIVTMKNPSTGKEARFMIADDFVVQQEVTLEVPVFKKGSPVHRATHTTIINKEATDGSHLMDRRFALENGLADESGKLDSAHQFRWGSPFKGLLYFYQGLHQELGLDAIFFKGGIKGDGLAALRKGGLDYAVLNRSRSSEPKPSLKLSRQVLSAIQNPALIAGLEADTKKLIERVLAFDESAIRSFLSIAEEILDEAGEDISEVEVDVDQLTTKLYSVGRTTFLKSHTMRKKLADLLRAALQSFSRGATLYLEDASFKHMMVDPYSIVQFMKTGQLSTTKGVSPMVGILPEHVLSQQLVETPEGKYRHAMDYRECSLFRFPFLHLYESRKVNIGSGDPFADEASRSFYKKSAGLGEFQGLIFYSLWDMNPEAQSGADFDGDQTLWTVNESIVSNLEQQPLFLDYSILVSEEGEEKLVSGCPFSGESRDLTVFANKASSDYMEEHNVSIQGDGIVFPTELQEEEGLINVIGQVSSSLAMNSLVQNDIGAFTNINSTVFHMMNTLEKHQSEILNVVRELAVSNPTSLELNDLFEAHRSLEKEKAGLNDFAFYMSMAIRWEIDKAKHGGEYREHLPFLDALTAKLSPVELSNMEKEYGISIQRLKFGRVII